MADDKMKHDDLKQNVGGQENRGTGQQSPGRNPQDDQSTGQRSGTDKQSRQGDTGNEGRGSRQNDDDNER